MSVEQVYNDLEETVINIDDTKEEKVVKTSKILISELIGTFLLVFGIIIWGAIGVDLPASSHAADSAAWNTVNKVFSTIVFKSFLVALLILILVFTFRRWSVNLNPAVTLAEVSKGNDSYSLGMMKIGVQLIGAFGATFLVGYVIMPEVAGTSAEVALANGYSLDGTKPIFKHINYEALKWGDVSTWYTTENFMANNNAWYWFIQLILEAVFTFGLIISVFWGGKMSENRRAFTIFFAVWAILIIANRFNTIALNPARLMGPAFVSKMLGQGEPMQFVWIYLTGELIAVALFHGLNLRAKAKAESETRIANVVAKSSETAASKEVYTETVDIEVFEDHNSKKDQDKKVSDSKKFENLSEEELESLTQEIVLRENDYSDRLDVFTKDN